MMDGGERKTAIRTTAFGRQGRQYGIKHPQLATSIHNCTQHRQQH